MPVTSFISSAGFGSGRRIYPKLEAFRMNISCQRLHIRKPAVRMNVARRIALSLPAVVNVDVFISSCLHSVARHGICLGADNGVAHLTREMIPTVPAHGRRLCKLATLRHDRRGAT